MLDAIAFQIDIDYKNDIAFFGDRIMARTDAEVVTELFGLYEESFGGKEAQRFLISWSGLRDLYGFRKLFESRLSNLAECAAGAGLYIWDLGEGAAGHFVAVVKIGTVDRWRKVPRRVLAEHAAPSDDGEDEAEEDD